MAQGNVAGTGEFLEAIGAKRVGETLRAMGAKGAAGSEARVPSLKDVKNPDDLLAWGKWSLGQGLASTVPSMVAAAAGAAAAGPIGGVVGAFAPAYMQNVGELRENLRRDGVNGGRLDAYALLAGIPTAALDAITPVDVANRLLRREVTNVVGKRAIGAIAKATVKDAVGEGVTEAMQEGIGQTTRTLATGKNKFDPMALFDSFAAGGLTGGVMGGAGEAVGTTREKLQQAKAAQRITNTAAAVPTQRAAQTDRPIETPPAPKPAPTPSPVTQGSSAPAVTPLQADEFRRELPSSPETLSRFRANIERFTTAPTTNDPFVQARRDEAQQWGVDFDTDATDELKPGMALTNGTMSPGRLVSVERHTEAYDPSKPRSVDTGVPMYRIVYARPDAPQNKDGSYKEHDLLFSDVYRRTDGQFIDTHDGKPWVMGDDAVMEWDVARQARFAENEARWAQEDAEFEAAASDLASSRAPEPLDRTEAPLPVPLRPDGRMDPQVGDTVTALVGNTTMTGTVERTKKGELRVRVTDATLPNGGQPKVPKNTVALGDHWNVAGDPRVQELAQLEEERRAQEWEQRQREREQKEAERNESAMEQLAATSDKDLFDEWAVAYDGKTHPTFRGSAAEWAESAVRERERQLFERVGMPEREPFWMKKRDNPPATVEEAQSLIIDNVLDGGGASRFKKPRVQFALAKETGATDAELEKIAKFAIETASGGSGGIQLQDGSLVRYGTVESLDNVINKAKAKIYAVRGAGGDMILTPELLAQEARRRFNIPYPGEPTEAGSSEPMNEPPKRADAAPSLSNKQRRQAEERARQKARDDEKRMRATYQVYTGYLADANWAIEEGDAQEIREAVAKLASGQMGLVEQYGDRAENSRVREILAEYAPDALARIDAVVAQLGAGDISQTTTEATDGPEVSGDDRPAGDGALRGAEAPAPDRGRSGNPEAAGAERGAGAAPRDAGQSGADAVRGSDAARGVDAERGDTVPGTGGGAAVGDDTSRQPDPARPGATPAERVTHTDFVYPEDHTVSGGPKTKVRANLAALTLLRELEQANRPATRAEQTILAKYVGWGAFPQVFDKAEWAAERTQLQQLLTPDEYAAARASTLNAHYTAPEVVRAMWTALRGLGFEGGRVLEPSAGIGYFLGMRPTDVASRVTAIELDTVTGKLAKYLYPAQDVRVEGFQDAKLAPESYDLAIGNVPFGDYRVPDPKYDQHKLNIHDYFFVKSLDYVRPGGVMAYITSAGTLDKQDAKARKLIAARAEFVGAVRLPGNAFLKNAGTAVVTDIIVLRKLAEGETATSTDWLGSSDTDGLRVNNYFLANPRQVLGRLTASGSMYRAGAMNVEYTGTDLAGDLAQALANIPGPAFRGEPASGAVDPMLPPKPASAIDPKTVKEGAFVLDGDTIFEKVYGELQPASLPKAAVPKVTALIGLRDALTSLRRAELSGDPTTETLRTALNAAYDAFVATHGPINLEKWSVQNRKKKDGTPYQVKVVTRVNLDHFGSDPDAPALAALEHYDTEGTDTPPTTATKADVLSRPTFRIEREITQVDTPTQALPIVLSAFGRVDLYAIARLSNTTEEEAARALDGQIYRDPRTGRWEPADLYLSGNVRVKLAEAQAAAEQDPALLGNVKALEAVQPAPKPWARIKLNLGAPWVPVSDVQQFVQEVLKVPAKIGYSESQGVWSVDAERWARGSTANTYDYGHEDADGITILKESLAGKKVQITYQMKVNGGEKTVVDVQATEAAQAKQRKLEEAFQQWAGANTERRDRLAAIFNERYNSVRWPEYDGRFLELPGTASHIGGNPFQFLPTQKNAIYRALMRGRTLFAHVVGAGKTFTMIATGMESRRLGLAQKPLYAVPNHMLGQFSREFLQLYPNARILAATKKDFAKGNRQRFLAKAAANEYDAIIMTHSSLGFIPLSPEFEGGLIQRELDALEDEIREAKKGKDSTITKELEKAKKKLEARLKALQAKSAKDAEFLSFEEIGVDQLFVDELHLYKNLYARTRMRGLPISSSGRAFDLWMKTQYLHQVNPTHGFYGATGTPISNSMIETYTMQRFFQPERLSERGIPTVDGWFQTFGEMVSSAELKPDGSGYQIKERPSKFKNLPELSNMFREFADVRLEDEVFRTTGDEKSKRPPMRGGGPINVTVSPTNGLLAYTRYLIHRGEQVAGKKAEKGADNILKIFTEGRVAASALRLLSRFAPTENPKIDALAARVLQEYEASTEDRGTQLIFSDVGTPKTKKAAVVVDEESADDEQGEEAEDDGFEALGSGSDYTVYQDLKDRLIAGGIPANEIAFIHDAKSDGQKQQLFDAVNAGAVRVLIGSSEKMGAGTNVQKRLVALHNLDTPRSMRPADLEQREGRAIRQGNLLWNQGKITGVAIYRYATERSMEANLWDMLQRKAKMVQSVMKGDPTVDEMEDLDSNVRDLETMKALASGNPAIMERVTLEREVQQLESARQGHLEEQRSLEKRATMLSTNTIPLWESKLEALREDLTQLQDTKGDAFALSLGKQTFTDRKDAGAAVLNMMRMTAKAWNEASIGREPRVIGKFAGLTLMIRVEFGGPVVSLVGAGTWDARLALQEDTSALGVVQSLEALVRNLPGQDAIFRETLTRYQDELVAVRQRVGDPWADQPKLDAKRERLTEVQAQTAESGPKIKFEPMADENSADWWNIVRAGVFPYTEVPVVERTEGEGDERGGGGPFNANFLGLQTVYEALFSPRRKEFTPAITASLKSVETRWLGARGITPGVNKETIIDKLREVRQAFTRHYRFLDTSASPALAASADQLRMVESASAAGKMMAVDDVRTVTDGLDAKQVDLLTRVLALRDVARSLDEGLYGEANDEGTYPKELPYGYPDRASVETDLMRYEAAAQRDPKVAAAITRRQAMTTQLTKRLVELDLLRKEVLDDDRYFHRQVMAHVNERASVGNGTRDLRVRKKGYQKQRTGGGDFNTLYQEAEFEWLAQAHSQIITKEAQQRIQAMTDIKADLVRQAKSVNEATMAARLAQLVEAADSDPAAMEQLMAWGITDPLEAADPLRPFRMRLGMAFGKLYTILGKGSDTVPPAFQGFVDALREEYADWKANGTTDAFTFSHPQLFGFLNWTLENDGPGAKWAATIFKAIRERQNFIKEVAGARFVTWEDLIPEGYTTWQPEEGNIFYRAATVEDGVLDRVLSGEIQLDESDVKSQLVMGGRKTEWVIPEGLAVTLDELQPATAAPGGVGIDRVWQEAEQTWKQWTLLNPLRVIKYNINNMAGDADIAFAYDPRIFTYAKDALRDLRALSKGTASPEVRAELREAMRRRVLDSGLSIAEIPDINETAAFRGLRAQTSGPLREATDWYWRLVRGGTTMRENLLRLAAYRYFQDELAKGVTHYGASKRHEVDAIRDPGERAAKLAAELIGDYGNISAAGNWVRTHLMPFYSWMEINAPRYVRMLANTTPEQRANLATRAAPAVLARAAVGTAGLALRMNALMLLAALWNRWVWPDEEDELRREGRDPHIILGRRADGTIISVRVEGAFADALDWFALKDYPADVADVVQGAASVWDKVAEGLKAPVERILNSWEPLTKSAFELASGRTLYPRVFKPGASLEMDARPIRDRGEYIARTVSLDALYARAIDKPVPPSKRGLSFFSSMLFYQTDPGEAAYWSVRDQVSRFKASIGKGMGGGAVTDRSTALLYFKLAVKYGEPDKAERWLTKYYELGGTRKGIKASLKATDPLGGLASADRAKFLRTLSPDQRAVVRTAEQWYDAQVRQSRAVLRTTLRPRRMQQPARPGASAPKSPPPA